MRTIPSALLFCGIAGLAVPVRAQVRGDPIVADSIAKLDTPDNEQAIAALAKAGKPAVGPLIDILESGKREVAWQAMRALRALGIKADSGKSRLVTMLRNTELAAWRRGLCAGALGAMPTGASTAVDSLITALGESPISDLQPLAAVALVEIGEPSGAALGRALTDKDRKMSLWAANLLVELGPKASRAKVSLQRVLEPDKNADEALAFLIQPSVTVVLRNLGSPYKEPQTTNDSLRILKSSGDKKYDKIGYWYHGGVLPTEVMKDQGKVRELLATTLDVGKGDPSFAISLPEAFEDTDRNDEFSVGEFVQGIGNHLASALRPLRQDLESDAIRSSKQWDEESAKVRGLLLALHALTRPEFLEKSRCLELSLNRFVGFYPP